MSNLPKIFFKFCVVFLARIQNFCIFVLPPRLRLLKRRAAGTRIRSLQACLRPCRTLIVAIIQPAV
jgi:hypothetical protein